MNTLTLYRCIDNGEEPLKYTKLYWDREVEPCQLNIEEPVKKQMSITIPFANSKIVSLRNFIYISATQQLPAIKPKI